MLCNATPLDTWGLMSAKAIFYDSYIFQVPSALQSNSTWHLGANVCYSASFSRLSRNIKFFEYGTKQFKVPAHLWSKRTGPWGLQVKFCSILLNSRKSKVKVLAYMLKSIDHSGCFIIWRLGGWRNIGKPEITYLILQLKLLDHLNLGFATGVYMTEIAG